MSGLIGKKIGMTSIFDDNGRIRPCTVIEAGPCTITQIKDQKKACFLKTHNVYGAYKGNHFTTPDLTLGAVIIVRDPRNVITSLKNHMDFQSLDQTFNFMADKNKILTNKEKVFSRNQFISSWKINYNSWCKMNNFRRLVITYAP